MSENHLEKLRSGHLSGLASENTIASKKKSLELFEAIKANRKVDGHHFTNVLKMCTTAQEIRGVIDHSMAGTGTGFEGSVSFIPNL